MRVDGEVCEDGVRHELSVCPRSIWNRFALSATPVGLTTLTAGERSGRPGCCTRRAYARACCSEYTPAP